MGGSLVGNASRASLREGNTKETRVAPTGAGLLERPQMEHQPRILIRLHFGSGDVIVPRSQQDP